MDNQILNGECQYNFEGCDKKVLAIFRSKWTCGRCLIKIENKLREKARKEIQEIEEELNGIH